MVVGRPSLFDRPLRLAQILEPLPVPPFVSELSVDALDEAVMAGSERRNERRADPPLMQSADHRIGSKLRAVIRANEGPSPAEAHQPRQNRDHVLVFNRASYLEPQTLAGVFIECARKPGRFSIGKPRAHEVAA